ncbi:DUF4352 domain-containing protein [Romboutsia sp. 1001216sp1]|uniref:DUF4352 domain-containing protein n=1 Tax=Romboutsia sp. 1001216sp1 TaxID=2986997 RepID=UPI0023305092|nr:DUF4352 domain-containing protein [Romboutsia sp. 1001216sp1]MDB8804738.1 DUF4352 domain-containing protein [Romboutsia sp. 1001216sp1]MDB8806338.1 DUF4352 domain-containing protein [Romboutsia sp. 1001216sp1]MDB8810384.1 DUF4352 domain-containing protein [Romboutsia sp. 1001216sp1]MDB8817542.1 DUF4352 domain-containing protein [Romboutsia sp. 1001216sp1]MDB8818581.1 DUF4352 domain-containing protein [Romboutsia sp. 1001216sp1]
MAKLINCKSCGNEIASNAKACPKCGAKNSKPFYKKIWFWVLVVIIIAAIAGSGSNKPKLVSEDKPIVTKEEKSNKEEVFNIGDTIELDKFKITVNEVKTTNGSDFIKPQEGNEFLYVDATVENISDKEQTVSSVLMFKVVDKDGRAMKQTIVENANGQLDGTIGPGRKMTGEYVVEVPKDATGLELQFDSSLAGNQVVVELK